jgi:hypothetical protein
MSEIKIRKVKIVKDKTLEVSYVKTEKDKSKTSVSESHAAEVHPDLKTAFSGLNIHLGILSEFIPSTSFEKLDFIHPDLVADFRVSGYSIGGDEDDEGVVLTGRKTLKSGKALIMNTPFTRFEEGEETGYKFISELQEGIAVIEKEVLKYLNDGKRAPDNQTSIDFPESPSEGRVSHMQVLPPESQEEKDEQHLSKMRSSRLNEAVTEKANPEAMARIRAMDKEEKVGGMIEGQRNKLRGRPSKKARVTGHVQDVNDLGGTGHGDTSYSDSDSGL